MREREREREREGTEKEAEQQRLWGKVRVRNRETASVFQDRNILDETALGQCVRQDRVLASGVVIYCVVNMR
jgi:hypothetical protein